jgi:integrase
MKLTDAVAASAALPARKNDVIHFDSRLQGFGLRLRRGADGVKKSWVLQYRDLAGKSRRFLIGTIDEMKTAKAREIAADKLAGIRLGNYPHEERRQAKVLALETFGSIAQLYLARRQPEMRPRSFVEIERHIKKRWAPFAEHSIHDITQRQVALRLNEIAEQSGKIEANRARAALSAFFTWAAREGITTTNPVMSTNKAVEERPRTRVLSDGEIAEIWAQLRDDAYGNMLRVLLLTAARREEVNSMAWDELDLLDLERGTWTLPSERAKNYEERIIPLSPPIISILAKAPNYPRRTGDRDFVFSGRTSGFGGWSAAKVALDVRVNAARKAVGNDQPMPLWRVHDLRRTAATKMGEDLGVAPHIIESILGHKSGYRGGVSGVYNRSVYATEVRNALLMWADHVRTITDGSDRKVIPMRPKEVPA